MAMYEILEPRKNRYDGFYNEDVPFRVVYQNMTAEEANHHMMYFCEYRYCARDMETGEVYYATTRGLKKYDNPPPMALKEV